MKGKGDQSACLLNYDTGLKSFCTWGRTVKVYYWLFQLKANCFWWSLLTGIGGGNICWINGFISGTMGYVNFLKQWNHILDNIALRVSSSVATAPTVRSSLQRRMTTEPLKDIGTPLTNLFLTVVVKAVSPGSSQVEWMGLNEKIHFTLPKSLNLFLYSKPWYVTIFNSLTMESLLVHVQLTNQALSNSPSCNSKFRISA